jgi:hypothetical protein
VTDLARRPVPRSSAGRRHRGARIARLRDALVEQVGPDVVGVMRAIKAALDPKDPEPRPSVLTPSIANLASC